MDNLGSLYGNFNTQANNFMDPVFLQGGVKPVLTLFLAVFGGAIIPLLPETWLAAFNTFPVRLLWLSLILWFSTKSPSLAIATAFCFLCALNLSLGKNLLE